MNTTEQDYKNRELVAKETLDQLLKAAKDLVRHLKRDPNTRTAGYLDIAIRNLDLEISKAQLPT